MTWATSMPILVFLFLTVLDLGPMYTTDVRQTSDAHHRLIPMPIRGGGIKTLVIQNSYRRTNEISYALTSGRYGDSHFLCTLHCGDTEEQSVSWRTHQSRQHRRRRIGSEDSSIPGADCGKRTVLSGLISGRINNADGLQ